jgi:hypothetical protein
MPTVNFLNFLQGFCKLNLVPLLFRSLHIFHCQGFRVHCLKKAHLLWLQETLFQLQGQQLHKTEEGQREHQATGEEEEQEVQATEEEELLKLYLPQMQAHHSHLQGVEEKAPREKHTK